MQQFITISILTICLGLTVSSPQVAPDTAQPPTNSPPPPTPPSEIPQTRFGSVTGLAELGTLMQSMAPLLNGWLTPDQYSYAYYNYLNTMYYYYNLLYYKITYEYNFVCNANYGNQYLYISPVPNP